MKNIIFDFDGTIADTAPLIVKTMLATMRELGLPMKDEATCRATIGLRLEEIPSVLWPDNPSAATRYPAAYRRIFDKLKHPLDTQCFPGVTETLRRLHTDGYRMAIASSRSHRSLSEYVVLFGIADCFDMLIGGDDVAKGKPAPDPVLAILNTMGWSGSETLTVGDAPVDILMGKSAGTQTCAVTYGNGNRAELEGARPDFIINGFRDLRSLLSVGQ